jgi:hypothetical protein
MMIILIICCIGLFIIEIFMLYLLNKASNTIDDLNERVKFKDTVIDLLKDKILKREYDNKTIVANGLELRILYGEGQEATQYENVESLADAYLNEIRIQETEL